MKVERKVDTVIVQMDIADAEALQELLYLVVDRRLMATHYPDSNSFSTLRYLLSEDAEVRFPSALTKAEAHEGYVVLRDTTPTEMSEVRDARFA